LGRIILLFLGLFFVDTIDWDLDPGADLICHTARASTLLFGSGVRADDLVVLCFDFFKVSLDLRVIRLTVLGLRRVFERDLELRGALAF